MFSADLNISRSDRGRAIIPVIFFLSPLVASAVPRLTWLFLPLIATALIVPVLRRGGEWRQLIQPNTALVAVLLVVLYVFFNATWAADRGVAFGKAALLLGVLLITFAASRAIAQFDKQQIGSAAIAFTAGAFLGALFLLFELLTHGAITRMAMNSIPLIKTTSAKRVVMSQGQILDINLSDLNQNVAIVMLNLWPGLLLLRTIEGGTRRAILVGIFFLAVAVPVLVSEHQSSQLALIGSLLIFSIAWMWRGAKPSAHSRSSGVWLLYSCCPSAFSPTRPSCTWRRGYQTLLGLGLSFGNTRPSACSTVLGSGSAQTRHVRSNSSARLPSNRRVLSFSELLHGTHTICFSKPGMS
jgi:hypothetical protein